MPKSSMVAYSTTSPITIAAGSDGGGGKLVVIDGVTAAGTTVGAATWTLTVADNAAATIWSAAQSVAATTTDTITVQFPRGLPCWTMTSGVSDFSKVPGAVTVSFNPSTINGITVTYHYEFPSQCRE